MSMSPINSPRSGDPNSPRSETNSVMESDMDVDDGGTPRGKDEEVLSLLTIVKEAESNVDAVVQYLVENGADLNAPDKYGMAPLHHSAMRGNKKAMQRLLNSPGIVLEPRDAQNSTPLHLAAT